MIKQKVKLFFQLGIYDLKEMWKNRVMRMALLGVLALPLIYSWIYLKAFFDPYKNMKYLPVAVVNEDKSVITNGKWMHIGKDIVKELGNDTKVKWEFVTRLQMKKGFHEGYYDIAVVIPHDFSKKGISVDSPEPLKSELLYYSDESNNYLSGRLGESIKRELKKNIEEKLTRVFAKKMFDQIKNSTNKLAEVATGAHKLADGTRQAEQVSKKLQESFKPLTHGLHKANEGINKLSNGTGQISDNVYQILDKALLAQSMVHQCNDLIQKITKEPIDSPVDTRKRIHDQIDYVKSKINEMTDNQIQSKQLIQQLLDKHPELADDSHIQRLQELLSVNSNRQNRLQSKVHDINQQIPLPQAINLGQFRKDIAIRSQQITNSIDEKINKMKKLAYGTNNIYVHLNQLHEGVEKLLQGSKQIGTGAEKLHFGLMNISEGQLKLADGLIQGVKNTNNSFTAINKKVDVFADPIKVKDHALHPVPNYATGFAPYFMSLSLWVGAMILFTIIDMIRIPNKAKKPLSLITAFTIGTTQAVILTSILMWSLGIKAQLPCWLYVFTIAMSFTFMMINRMLIVLLDHVGRFMAIVLLMLQLTSCGGTYPVSLLPTFFQWIHPYLPMTYSIHGLRAALSNGNINFVIHDFYILSVFICGALIITKIHCSWIKPSFQNKGYKST
jgi:putative membrane protein